MKWRPRSIHHAREYLAAGPEIHVRVSAERWFLVRFAIQCCVVFRVLGTKEQAWNDIEEKNHFYTSLRS
jgi:hypothetical protein